MEIICSRTNESFINSIFLVFLPCARHRGNAVKKGDGNGHKFFLSWSLHSSGETHNKQKSLVKPCIRSDECHGEKAGRREREEEARVCVHGGGGGAVF